MLTSSRRACDVGSRLMYLQNGARIRVEIDAAI
jgi:hypothetical protein